MEKPEPLSIMIVDDEMLVRTGIASFLNWSEYGYIIAAQAANGLEALEMMREGCPDIILLDIKMPEMNGVELLRILKREQLPVKVIVLSCHNELDYVKESIRLGAEDYILKLSLQPEALLAKLSEVRKKIEAERKDKNGGSGKLSLKDSDDLLNGLITGQITVEEAGCLEAKELRLLVLHPAEFFPGNPAKAHPTPLQQRSLIHLCKGMAPQDRKVHVVCLSDGNYVLLLRGGMNITNEEITDFVNKFQTASRHYLSLVVSAGVSAPFTSIRSIREAYRQAVNALQRCYYFHAGALLFFSQDFTFLKTGPALSADEDESLRRCVINGDSSAAKNIIENFFSGVLKTGSYPPDRVRFTAVEIIHGLYKMFPRVPEFNEDLLFKSETLAELRMHVFDFIDTIVLSWKESRAQARHPGILRAKELILSRLDRTVSLEEAAVEAGMSKCYFSTIFAQETGESFTGYVNRMKIERARTLLLRDGLSNNEAAERIGLTDVSYFGKLFKKHTGLSPAQFRRSGTMEGTGARQFKKL